MAPESRLQSMETMMNDKPKSKPDKAQNKGAAKLQERRARQARSLRDNLKRRKQQVRSRRDEEKSPQ